MRAVETGRSHEEAGRVAVRPACHGRALVDVRGGDVGGKSRPEHQEPARVRAGPCVKSRPE
jgi:hypothetical protein